MVSEAEPIPVQDQHIEKPKKYLLQREFHTETEPPNVNLGKLLRSYFGAKNGLERAEKGQLLGSALVMALDHIHILYELKYNNACQKLRGMAAGGGISQEQYQKNIKHLRDQRDQYIIDEIRALRKGLLQWQLNDEQKNELEIVVAGFLGEYAVAAAAKQEQFDVYYPEREEDVKNGVDWYFDISQDEEESELLAVQVKCLRGCHSLQAFEIEYQGQGRDLSLSDGIMQGIIEANPDINSRNWPVVEDSVLRLAKYCQQTQQRPILIIIPPPGEDNSFSSRTGLPTEQMAIDILEQIDRITEHS